MAAALVQAMIISFRDDSKMLPNWLPSSCLISLQPILPAVVGVTIPVPQRCQLIPITLRPKSEVFMRNIKALPEWPLATSLTYCLWVFSTALNLLQVHLFALPWRPADMFLLQGFCTGFALCMESTSQDSLPQMSSPSRYLSWPFYAPLPCSPITLSSNQLSLSFFITGIATQCIYLLYFLTDYLTW